MKKAILPITLATLLTAPLVSAGWGDLIKDVKESGGQLLQQPILDSGDKSAQLDTATLIDGLKEALEVGSKRAIEEISAPGGYLDNQQIRIPLPDSIDKVARILKKYGLEDQVNQFEESMNRAAEKAAPQATALIVDAIKAMSFDDARKIYNGPDNAATEYFKEKTSAQLRELFKPSVDNSLNEVGATRYYGELAQEAKDIPFVGEKLNVDLDDYVTEEALNGLFTVLEAEEKLIREDPAARTTDLLKKVFN